MIKTTICIRRKPGLDHSEFVEYWSTRHAALIKELQPQLKIVRYVQSHALDNDISAGLRLSRNGPPMYDGIGEAWFNSMDDLRSLGTNPESVRALALLIEDEKHFIDLSRSPFWVAEEREVISAD